MNSAMQLLKEQLVDMEVCVPSSIPQDDPPPPPAPRLPDCLGAGPYACRRGRPQSGGFSVGQRLSTVPFPHTSLHCLLFEGMCLTGRGLTCEA